MDDDRIGHAELDVAGRAVPLRRVPRDGIWARPRGRVSVSLHLSVPDVDAAVAPGRLGAIVERPPTDPPYGRTGVIVPGRPPAMPDRLLRRPASGRVCRHPQVRAGLAAAVPRCELVDQQQVAADVPRR